MTRYRPRAALLFGLAALLLTCALYACGSGPTDTTAAVLARGGRSGGPRSP